MERLGDGIERELARSGSPDAVPLARITAAWPAAVGPAIARRAWPLRLARDGTLHVATASATWANELTLLGADVLASLREHVGEDAPAMLRCAAGPIPEPPQELDEPSPEAVDVPADVASTASSVASAIDDPELRELVVRAARASLGRRASDRHF
jgi:hypothetical protein